MLYIKSGVFCVAIARELRESHSRDWNDLLKKIVTWDLHPSFHAEVKVSIRTVQTFSVHTTKKVLSSDISQEAYLPQWYSFNGFIRM